MRTTNTFGIQFIIRINKAKDGLAAIYARITVDVRRVEISLKRKINPEDWDNIKGKAKGQKPEIKSLNHFLEEIRTRLVENYQELQLHKELITADTIKDMFLGLDQKDYTLCKLVEYHNQVIKSTLAWGTMKNYLTTQKYIKEFLKERYRTTDIYLCRLSFKFITDFEYYLRNREPEDHQKHIGNNGVMKHFERFRKMVTMAVKMEWLDRDPFEEYQLKFNHFERGFLSEHEVGKD